MKLLGKTAFITGCNRGVGKTVCENFLANGANIICAVRKKTTEFSNSIIYFSVSTFVSPYKVIGVNSMGLDKSETEGLNFAIYYQEVLDFVDWLP